MELAMEQDRQIEKEIFEIEGEIFAAIKRKDPKQLDQVLSNDFSYRNPIDGDLSRADFLTAIKSLPVEIISVWSEDMKLTVFGDIVVASGTQLAKILNDDGDEEISAAAFVDVFVKRQDKWKLAWAHGVDLPSPKKPGKPQPKTV
jgi:ketosteroid isomerase-like protein